MSGAGIDRTVLGIDTPRAGIDRTGIGVDTWRAGGVTSSARIVTSRAEDSQGGHSRRRGGGFEASYVVPPLRPDDPYKLRCARRAADRQGVCNLLYLTLDVLGALASIEG
jgi:hypothetical protein